MSESMDISVIIGFRDWGLERLKLSVEALVRSSSQMRSEIIVCDFGSSDGTSVEAVTIAAGGKYHRVDDQPVWSRARALNAGLSIASGKYLACTDADMLFSPEVLPSVVASLEADSSRFFVLQCQDLPPAFDAEGVRKRFPEEIDWAEIQKSARYRPRWGMGGFIAFSREKYYEVRGLDERMEIYGGEDIDLASRLSRVGLRLEWLENPGCDMYHIWHPSSRTAASTSNEGARALELNRSIMLEDGSAIRNITDWQFRPATAYPPITVALATHNRADVLSDSINSVLAQTMADFELVVMDDGSDDETSDLLDSYDDERIVKLYQPNSGVAAARNAIARNSHGAYTVVHDSDDIMPPWRLETHLSKLRPGMHGNYGAAVNFDNDSGALSVIRGKRFSLPALLFNSQVLLHGTLMVSTSLLRRVGYNESLRSGTDYNLAVRLAKIGAVLEHTGALHLVRRVHSKQMTNQDSRVQVLSSHLTNSMARTQMGAKNEAYHRKNRNDEASVDASDAEFMDLAKPLLPDHLVRRQIVAHRRKAPIEGRVSRELSAGSVKNSLKTSSGDIDSFVSSDVSWDAMADVSRRYRIDRVDTAVSKSSPEHLRSLIREAIDIAAGQLLLSGRGEDHVFLSIWPVGRSMPLIELEELARYILDVGSAAYVCSVTSRSLSRDSNAPLYEFRLF